MLILKTFLVKIEESIIRVGFYLPDTHQKYSHKRSLHLLDSRRVDVGEKVDRDTTPTFNSVGVKVKVRCHIYSI